MSRVRRKACAKTLCKGRGKNICEYNRVKLKVAQDKAGDTGKRQTTQGLRLWSVLNFILSVTGAVLEGLRKGITWLLLWSLLHHMEDGILGGRMGIRDQFSSSGGYCGGGLD